MGRVSFQSGKQSLWINKVVAESGLNFNELAKFCGVSSRTLRDWKREKYKISEDAFLGLQKRFNVSYPLDIKILPDFWYVTKGASKGALRRMELYGPLGTADGRSKGGKISQKRRRQNPEKYRALGCIVRKSYRLDGLNEEFAELVGILLGDGGITDSQVKITVSSLTDRLYAKFISDLTYKIFGEHPSVFERDDHTIHLTISGVGLVELLIKWGLVKGNKMMKKIDFPDWVWDKVEFKRACVRGLMDTDGGLYFHKHWVKGIKYRNLGLCFTSYSPPLLQSVEKVLNEFSIKHTLITKGRIYIYDLEHIRRYFSLFETHNPKNKSKMNYHLKTSRVLS